MTVSETDVWWCAVPRASDGAGALSGLWVLTAPVGGTGYTASRGLVLRFGRDG